jgi:PHD/YefM family antitoxin component YafN of YafNO toxin-antitoxin module
MDVTAVSKLKARMPAVLKDLRRRGAAILVVSKGQPQAVLQDIAAYQATQDAIALLKMMTQSEKSVAAGRGSSTKEVMARLRARVRARSGRA